MEKMKIFISWSGSRSLAVAEALKKYLPFMNNAFDPWLSSNDIPKGSRSTAEIAQALATAKAGIICLTPNNLNERWILFEAGGIAKTVDKPLACTLLIDLKPSDVSQPLADFQATFLTKEHLLDLIRTLNAAAGEGTQSEARLEIAFNLCWPQLKEKLDTLPNDGPTARPGRTTDDVLVEVLDTLRGTNARDSHSLELLAEGVANLTVRTARIERALDETSSISQFTQLRALLGGSRSTASAPPPPLEDPPSSTTEARALRAAGHRASKSLTDALKKVQKEPTQKETGKTE